MPELRRATESWSFQSLLHCKGVIHGTAASCPEFRRFCRARGRCARALAARSHVRAIARAAPRCAAVRVLRRPAVRDRAAALRPHPDHVHEGRRAALRDDARQVRAAALGLGLSRPAGRARGREGARVGVAGGDRAPWRRPVQRRLPHARDAVRIGVGDGDGAARPLGRLRRRLQDDGRLVRRVGGVGVQAAPRCRAGVRGPEGRRVLRAVPDRAVELRDPDGRRVPRARRPRADGEVPTGRRRWRGAAGVDDNAVDAAGERRARGPSRARVRPVRGRPELGVARGDGGARHPSRLPRLRRSRP